MVGVKLAEEINLPCDVDLPIQDFSTPTSKDVQEALAKTIALLKKNPTIYVGCMGGFGRTGLFMALLTKVALHSARIYEVNPIDLVRGEYVPNAVETKSQEDLVTNFDPRLLIATSKFL